MEIGIVTPIIRQVLMAVGGVLIGKGYIDQTGFELVSGVVLQVVPLIWWFFDRKKINDANAAK